MSTKRGSLSAAFVGLLFVAAVPAHAHHSFAAVFDSTKPVAVTGTISACRVAQSSYLVLRRREGAQRRRHASGDSPVHRPEF